MYIGFIGFSCNWSDLFIQELWVGPPVLVPIPAVTGKLVLLETLGSGVSGINLGMHQPARKVLSIKYL